MNLLWLIFFTLPTPNPADAGEIDTVYAGVQTVYDEIVEKGGRVDYARLKQTPDLIAKLERFETFVASINLETITDKNEKIALLANTYNVFTILGVSRSWPVDSVRKISPLFGFFKRTKWTFAGKEVTLDSIENQYLRPLDNRIHFLINCASVSCPDLAPTLITGANVTSLMEENTRNFLNDTGKNRFDPENRKYHLSKIFKWFGEDWGGKQGVIAFIQSYREDLAGWQPDKLVYLDYDWSLNGPQK